MARKTSTSPRLELRLKTAEKALLVRAAEIERTDLTGLVLRTMLPAAAKIVEKAERLQLSEAASIRVLDLLDKAPAPNSKLVAAAKRMDRRNMAPKPARATTRSKNRVSA